MSFNLSPQSPMRPLGIGNVVSAGMRLYTSHLKSYLGLSLKAVLWSLIPIYGWAKACTINAQIARLAFSELVNQPESVKSAEDSVSSRMWSFLGLQILVSIILFVANFGLSIVGGFITAIPTLILRNSLQDAGVAALIALIRLVVNLATFVAYIWVYSRVMIPELPLAIESNVDVGTSISRSWDLTKGSVLRIQGVVLVASLITLPIFVLVLIPIMLFIPSFMSASSSPDTLGGAILLFFLSILIVALLANLLMMPFWQAIKAVIYYDLRSRREGLGLQLRDRSI